MNDLMMLGLFWTELKNTFVSLLRETTETQFYQKMLKWEKLTLIYMVVVLTE